MGSNTYVRFLARLAGRQPRLRPPPDANLTVVSPLELADLMPYTHPISGYRSRSFERRCLELRVVELPSERLDRDACPPLPPSPCGESHEHRRPTLATGEGGQGLVSGVSSGSHRTVGGRITEARRSGGGGGDLTSEQRSSHQPGGGRAAGASQGKPAAQLAARVLTDTPTGDVALATASTSAGAVAAGGGGGLALQAPTRDPHLLNHRHPQPPATAGPQVESSSWPSVAISDGAVRQELAGAAVAAQSVAHPGCGSGSPHPDSPSLLHPHLHPHSHPQPHPPHSYMEVRYPFASLPWLWREYYRPGFPGLDPALILEDFDTFAADVAARHVGLVPDSMLVTAILERMTWHVHLQTAGDSSLASEAAPAPAPASPTATTGEAGSSDGVVGCSGGGGGASGRTAGAVASAATTGPEAEAIRSAPLAELAPTNMKLAGQVTWVGRSSMEVLLQLTAEAPLITPPPPFATTATAAPRCSGVFLEEARTVAIAHLPNDYTAPAAAAPADAGGGGRSTITLAPGQLVATAEFVMALRDSSLRRAVDVPPLHPRDPLERELFRRGRDHHHQRLSRRERDASAHASAAVANPGSGGREAGGDGAVGGAVAKSATSAAAMGGSRQPAQTASSVAAEAESGTLAPKPTAAEFSAPARPRAAADDEAELVARLLYDNILRADLRRTMSPDVGALQFSASEPFDCDGTPLGRTRKRRRRVLHGEDAPAALDIGGGLDLDFRETRGTPPDVLVHAHAHAPSTTPDGDGAHGKHAKMVPIRETELHRTVIAEFQDRNTSGTVFGGHLLRLAYEHAAAATAAFAGAPCELLWLEEGVISAPARVGDVLHAVSRVVWAEPGGRALRVVVRVGKYDIAAPSQHMLALTLAAAFLVPAAAARKEGGLVGLAPTTLMEAGEVLAAQRRHAAVVAALAAEEAVGPRP